MPVFRLSSRQAQRQFTFILFSSQKLNGIKNVLTVLSASLKITQGNSLFHNFQVISAEGKADNIQNKRKWFAVAADNTVLYLLKTLFENVKTVSSEI